MSSLTVHDRTSTRRSRGSCLEFLAGWATQSVARGPFNTVSAVSERRAPSKAGRQCAMKRTILTAALVIAVVLCDSTVFAQTISDRIYDPLRKPGAPVIIGTLGEPTPLSIDEMTKRSDLVVETKLSRVKTYINAADTAVITDFEMSPTEMFVGTLPPLGRTLVLTTYGGELVKDGITVRAENHNLGELKENVTYLLFLKRFGSEPDAYQIYNVGAFERSGDTARPLARDGADLFKDFNKSYAGLLTQARESARARPR
jgi:hypothetical protein